VAEEAAKMVKRVHLELGGKAPVVVFDDADPAKAAEWLAVAGYFNAGQDCTAATRVLVQDGIHDDFVAALAEQATATTTTFANGPTDEDALVPPLNNVAQFENVLGFLERKPAHANIAAGGARQGERGYFLEPTVVVDMQQDDEMIQNEIFGPVMTVQRFSDEATAMQFLESLRKPGRTLTLEPGLKMTHTGRRADPVVTTGSLVGIAFKQETKESN
jgi:betaine-aldehyde dehydrogenase